MFRGSVKSTGYPLHSPVSPFPSPPVRHRVPSHFNWTLMLDTPCSEVVWRVLATHSIRQIPPSLTLPCVTVWHHISTGVYFNRCLFFYREVKLLIHGSFLLVPLLSTSFFLTPPPVPLCNFGSALLKIFSGEPCEVFISTFETPWLYCCRYNYICFSMKTELWDFPHTNT